MSISKRTLRIAAVGDVHDAWDLEDHRALKALEVDLVLFVGDFGNESLETVRRIAALDLPKATVFGNHDAWYTATEWGRQKCPYNREHEDWFQIQLELLQDYDVGYGYRDWPELELSVVGGRPFSWGGPLWKHEEFYHTYFDVNSFADSTDRILSGVKAANQPSLIFLAHCGPTGLGDAPEAPCGRDWQPIGGDHGDPDLEQAIVKARSAGRAVPLVVFGHMHHQLRHTKTQKRQRVHRDAAGTVYLNAADVPRIVRSPEHTLRNFSLIQLSDGVVQDINLLWLDEALNIQSQETLYSEAEPVTDSALCSL
ncbi:TIGR04168 family protein [Leptolyngbya sp. FACHB-261]|uniref:TIGR04168 family protein n=1 Tax=Leptolyngbya sp. FACHB-261 TaxID=2692806 RepID=UPI0016820865|nr:TIGR04168 family protein [Leptolyngbya sp. FACHB-261]MBD2099339.1 TIGR04168 family protein [Leptolyngbya sp. FACHB-261]